MSEQECGRPLQDRSRRTGTSGEAAAAEAAAITGEGASDGGNRLRWRHAHGRETTLRFGLLPKRVATEHWPGRSHWAVRTKADRMGNCAGGIGEGSGRTRGAAHLAPGAFAGTAGAGTFAAGVSAATRVRCRAPARPQSDRRRSHRGLGRSQGVDEQREDRPPDCPPRTRAHGSDRSVPRAPVTREAPACSLYRRVIIRPVRLQTQTGPRIEGILNPRPGSFLSRSPQGTPT